MEAAAREPSLRATRRVRRYPIARTLAFLGTLRGRILVAFLVMSAITGALGISAALSIRHTDELVSRTFDRSLMSINYARAAAADFAELRAIAARRWSGADPEGRAGLAERIETLKTTLKEDLGIAVERAQSRRATRAAEAFERAANAWIAAQAALSETSTAADWAALDHLADAVAEHLDLFVNHTAGDGFTYRQQARAVVAHETQINLLGTLGALLLSGTVAFLLARRIMGPVADASMVASRIARGDLAVTIPRGSTDELGALLASMTVMRDNIRRAMEQEVAQRRSAEMQLANALATSREGIVVLDGQGRITLTNRGADDFLGLGAAPKAGTPLTALAGPGSRPNGLARVLAEGAGGSGGDGASSEFRLDDGRWLRIGRSGTGDGGTIAVCSDITVMKDQEARLQSTNLRLDTALDNMSQGLCLFDAAGRLTVINRRYGEIVGVEPDALPLGLSHDAVLALGRAADDPVGDAAEAAMLAARSAPGGPAVSACIRRLANGRIVSIAHKAVHGGGWVATYEDVTEQRQADERIAYMARHDALTGLPNRVMFGEEIDGALGRLGRGAAFAVLCLDLDRFKEVNETLGHPVGDALLQAVANRLRACVREIDCVARLGGDEFAIILSDITRPEDAAILARRIVDVVSGPYALDGHGVVVGVSVGICLAPGDGASCDKLLKNADVALYRAKAEGRGTWRFFEPEMDIRLQSRRALEVDLRDALAQEAFELYYQPLYDLRRDRVGGFEALIRWHHPTRGMVPPGEFIAAVEEIGLIVPLGAWVLRTACVEAMGWPADVKVAVNVSAAQFADATIVQSTIEALAASGLPAQRLELEITESVLLKDNVATLATLHALRRLGVRIAMDDFGTGYSSLSYLRSFPFDKLKIDQSFLRDLDGSGESGVIVRAMIGLGTSVGMRTTGEGVETLLQADFLRAEGCDEAQGYYFGRPGPARDVPAAIARWETPSRAVA